MNTKVFWINRKGELRQHSMGTIVSLNYVRNWWRENILECQGILFVDERRESKLAFVKAEPTLDQ